MNLLYTINTGKESDLQNLSLDSLLYKKRSISNFIVSHPEIEKLVYIQDSAIKRKQKKNWKLTFNRQGSNFELPLVQLSEVELTPPLLKKEIDNERIIFLSDYINSKIAKLLKDMHHKIGYYEIALQTYSVIPNPDRFLEVYINVESWEPEDMLVKAYENDYKYNLMKLCFTDLSEQVRNPNKMQILVGGDKYISDTAIREFVGEYGYYFTYDCLQWPFKISKTSANLLIFTFFSYL